MGIAVDYTARIDPAALKAAGVTDVLRYISLPQANTAWKRISLGEYQELLAAGVRVTLNFEYAATDWLGGAAAGAAHAAEAVRQAKALGYPTGCTIPGSADFNMSRAQWDAAGHGYAQAFAAGIRAGGYRPGVYGPYNVLTWCRDAALGFAMFWQAGMSAAWDNNAGPWPGAHLRQRRHLAVAGQDTDLNDILITEWGQAGGDMLADERAALFELRDRARWMDPRLAATADGSDTYKDAAGAVHQAHDVQDRKALLGKLDQMLAAAATGFTDAQAAAMADRIASALAAHPDTPLGDADKPAIVAAVKQALAEGVGSA